MRYAKLRTDHEHAHAPDEMAIGIVDIDVEDDEIIGITNPSTLYLSPAGLAALQDALSVSQFFNRMARRIEVRHISP